MLTKARLSLLVLMTTFVGFCLGTNGPLDWLLLVHSLFGTALVTGSAAVLNQVLEAKVDRLMGRTRNRPLAAARMKRSSAVTIGLLLAFGGLGYLAVLVNNLTAVLAGLTLVVYLLLYTPLKRRTSFCVIVGAVSGAIPPMIGWTSVTGSLGQGAWVLFGVLFFWQMPHFLAIAWIYRDEYAGAGFVMLPKNDPRGSDTALQSLVFTVALALVSFAPLMFSGAGATYFIGALLCNAAITACAAQFLMFRTRESARRLFFASIIYLPCLLGLMVFTR